MSFGDFSSTTTTTNQATAAASGLSSAYSGSGSGRAGGASSSIGSGDKASRNPASTSRPIPLARTGPSSAPGASNQKSTTAGPGVLRPSPLQNSSSVARSASPESKMSSVRRLWDRASNSVFEISNNVASLDSLVKQLGTSRDTAELRSRLHELTDSTRDMIKQTGADLRSLVIPENASNFEGRQHRMAQQKLQKDFESVLSRFQDVSKLAAKKSREYVQKAKSHQHHMQRDSGDDHEPNENAPLLQQQEEVLDSEVEYNESLILEREQDLQNIERSIIEVNEIFRDLGTIVGEQQFMLDHVESNVGSVAVNMEGATGELRIAAERQKAAQNRMCCLYTILGTVGVIVIVVLFR